MRLYECELYGDMETLRVADELLDKENGYLGVAFLSSNTQYVTHRANKCV